ncbi:MAG: hypothetical protein HY858_12065 [Candidatus Solibacter usitatus]|nr:hypothetical protein [Candidatus Solibacter usitatus]
MRTLVAALLAAGLLCADDKPNLKTPSGAGADQRVSIEATAYLDRDEMRKALGQDPGNDILVVQVKITPAPGEKFRLDRDDFLLRSDRDGQRSRPLEPSQIAGSSVMVVSSRGGTQGAGMSEQRRIPIGGYPGGYPGGGYPGGGYPGGGLPVPGQSPNVGSATADTSEATASIEDKPAKASPLLEVLKEKLLPDSEELDKPVSGFLYFQIEGKIRPKDLELVYRKSPPRVSVRFIPPKKK